METQEEKIRKIEIRLNDLEGNLNHLIIKKIPDLEEHFNKLIGKILKNENNKESRE